MVVLGGFQVGREHGEHGEHAWYNQQHSEHDCEHVSVHLAQSSAEPVYSLTQLLACLFFCEVIKQKMKNNIKTGTSLQSNIFSQHNVGNNLLFADILFGIRQGSLLGPIIVLLFTAHASSWLF